uniref:p12-4p n=1 Tax=Pyrococcus sp. 12/1 TaxID=758582 RepID=D6MY10_9EURY|nr:hypothetical protein [Pyrococcus sp. 12/1]ADF80211.1 p12-4p [Pyrococcus sp. 12/1]
MEEEFEPKSELEKVVEEWEEREEELEPGDDEDEIEVKKVGEEDEDEEEEEDDEKEIVVNNVAPPILEWAVGNDHFRVEIRIWKSDEKAFEMAMRMFERSLVVMKDGKKPQGELSPFPIG